MQKWENKNLLPHVSVYLRVNSSTHGIDVENPLSIKSSTISQWKTIFHKHDSIVDGIHIFHEFCGKLNSTEFMEKWHHSFCGKSTIHQFIYNTVENIFPLTWFQCTLKYTLSTKNSVENWIPQKWKISFHWISIFY